MLVTLIFYMGRIPTLLCQHRPFVSASLRYSINPDTLNYSFIFIMFCNISIFLGLYAVKGKNRFREYKYTDQKPPDFSIIIMLLSFAYLLAFGHFLNIGYLGRLVGYLRTIFIYVPILLLSTLVYIVVNGAKIPVIHRIGVLEH